MADVLTNLRELSVGISFFYFDNPDDITPATFRNLCISNISGFDSRTPVSQGDEFSVRELQTIKNGIILGKRLGDVLGFRKSNPSIRWRGNEKDDLIDLQINDTNISLKEKSWILKNMGLYSVLNILTNSDKFRRGVHIFETFAPDEFEQWFESAIKCLMQNPKFEYTSPKGYTSRGRIEKQTLYLTIDNTTVEIPDIQNLTYAKFNQLTNSKIREKVFCKWLSNAADKNYHDKKRVCAMTAGKNLEKYINQHLVNSSPAILNLFNLEKYEYIYAKNDGHILQISKVPGIDTVDYTNWCIEKVEVSIPDSQLNLKTTIRNVKTGKLCTFRNEIRYSHGQFNGTPEAKLYVEAGDNLEDIIYLSLI